MTSPCPPLLVATPTVTPWRYGLLSVATVIEETDPHFRCGVIYKSPHCARAVAFFEDACTPAPVNPKLPTDVDRDAIVTGAPFTIYSYLSCKTTTLAAMRDEVRLTLELGESRAVEEGFWTAALAVPGCTVLNTTPGAAGALSLVAGVAALESAMAQAYGGVPTLHGDRSLAAYAANAFLLQRSGGRLLTPLDSLWAFYGGSPNTGPDGVVAPAGYAWLYATSGVTLRRSPVQVLPDDGHELRVLPDGSQTNEPIVVAERVYVPTHECACFAVLICEGACP